MPTSSLAIIDGMDQLDDGTVVLVVSTPVKFFNIDSDATVSPDPNLSTDANAILSGATIAVAAGTNIRARIENFHGGAGYTEIVSG